MKKEERREGTETVEDKEETRKRSIKRKEWHGKEREEQGKERRSRNSRGQRGNKNKQKEIRMVCIGSNVSLIASGTMFRSTVRATPPIIPHLTSLPIMHFDYPKFVETFIHTERTMQLQCAK